MNMQTKLNKRSRAERKAAHRAQWEQQEQYRRQHPVLSGVVPVVDYEPPAGTYTRCPGDFDLLNHESEE